MTDCGCEKAKAELEEYLRRELSDQAFADIEEHLAGCEDCSREHLIAVALTQKVKRACCETAPEELRLSIRAKIETLRLG